VLTWHRRRALAGFLFILPTWFAWVFWTLGPAIATLGISFSSWNFVQAPKLVGLDNYTRMLSDELFVRSVRNSHIYALVFVPVGVIFALCLAILINSRTRLREYYRVAYFLPVVTSAAATSILWKWLYQPSFGLINTALGQVGINGPSWLNDPQTALLSVGIMGVWQDVGFLIVLFLAGLQSIPPSLYEAADIDGANGFQQAWYLTVPLLRPTALFVSVISMAGAFQVFVQIFIMTKGGPAYASSVLAYYLYLNAFQKFEMGYAAAIAMVIFLLVMIITLLQLKVFRQAEAD
jgi:multiple sugar transport system permease protein